MAAKPQHLLDSIRRRETSEHREVPDVARPQGRAVRQRCGCDDVVDGIDTGMRAQLPVREQAGVFSDRVADRQPLERVEQPTCRAGSSRRVFETGRQASTDVLHVVGIVPRIGRGCEAGLESVELAKTIGRSVRPIKRAADELSEPDTSLVRQST